MRNPVLTRRLFALCLSFLLVGPTFGQDAGTDEKPEKPSKSVRSKKPIRPSKADSKDADTDTKSDLKGDTKDDAAMEEKEGDDDGNGFGASRKSPTKKGTVGRGESKTTKMTPQEKEKAKLAKVIEKQLGKKEEGYFVFQLRELKIVERSPDEKPAAPPVASNQAAQPQIPFEPVETVEFHVVDGRETALTFIVDYLSEFPPPEKKSRTKRSQKNTSLEIPPPQREWGFIRYFPATADGNQAAQAMRDEAKTRYEQQQAKDLRKY